MCTNVSRGTFGALLMSVVLAAFVGDASADPPPPTVAVSATIKQLTFTWASVPSATRYRLLQNPDGHSGFTQVGADLPGNAVSASVEVAVHRHNWVNALYRVEACNSDGCTGSSSISAVNVVVQAIGYFKASNTQREDIFGRSIALSADGRTLAVGAPNEDSNATGVGNDQSNDLASFAGAVYVFTRVGAQWFQQAYIKASNTEAGDSFGGAVALSADGDTLAVGARGEASNGVGVGSDQFNNLAPIAGAAYVFTRNGAQWSQQAFVKASNTGAGDQFGLAVALSATGNTLAVSAPFEDSNGTGIGNDQSNNSATSAGAVYVFTRAGTRWSQEAFVKASNTEAGDSFGNALALSGNGTTLAVGARSEDSNAAGVGNDQSNNIATSAGAVYVFTRGATQWAQQAYVKASNTGAGDEFGVSVALSGSGNTLAVGAIDEDSDSVGVNNEHGDNRAAGAGAAYVFTRNGTRWSEQAYVKASNTNVGDQFGAALTLSSDGNTLAVGAFNEDSIATGVNNDQADNTEIGAGAVYVFTRDGTLWSQQAYVKASNTGLADAFGNALALSSDGDTLAVSAQLENSNAVGVGGDQNSNAAPSAGAVYLY